MSPNFSSEQFAETAVDPAVRGFLDLPATASGDGLVLTHGAGGNCQAPLLVALAEAFADAGFIVLRCNLPYRQARPYGPPRPGDAARDREGLKNAVRALRKLASGRMFLGGHSYGGRQASMLCAEEPRLVNGLLLTFLSAARAGQARSASHSASAEVGTPHPLRAGHSRCLRIDRGNRVGLETHSGANRVAEGRRRWARSGIQRES